MAMLAHRQATDGAEILFHLRFPARADRLKLIRAGIAGAAEMCGFPAPQVFDIVLAVDEACQNIIRHAYKGDDNGEAMIEVYRLANGIRVTLHDDGPPVNPAEINPRPLEEVAPGGLGTHFMRQIMDRVDYQPAHGGRGNILELSKYLEQT